MKFIRANGALVALIVLVLVDSVMFRKEFLSLETIRNLFLQNAAVGMLAVGMTLVIVSGGIDLSVGSMMCLTATIGLLAMNKVGTESIGVLVAVLVSVALGALTGFFNALLITAGRIAPFIATLAGLVAYRSVCLAIADGGEINATRKVVFEQFAKGGITIPGLYLGPDRPFNVPWPVIVFLLIAFGGSWILNRSRFGRRLIAVGANERAAIYSGIDVAKIKWGAYTALGVCVGFAAVCQSARMTSVTTSTLGLYKELDAIAAVAIGGAAMSGGRGRVWPSVVGAMILGLIEFSLQVSSVSVYWQGCVKGAIILVAVLIQRGGDKS